MSLALVASVALGLAAPPPAGPGPSTVTLTRDYVEYGDLIDVTRLPLALRDRVRRMRLAWFGHGGRPLLLHTRRAEERLRAMLPDSAAWLADAPDRQITFVRATKAALAPAIGCSEVAHPLPANAFVTPADLKPAACLTETDERPFRYDRANKAVRARRALAVGERMVSPPYYALARARVGQVLVVRTTVGPVTVERDVKAAQAAVAGRAVFVRGADGEVFSAPTVSTAP